METTKTKEQEENDNLAQVQGFPNFENSPKGDPTIKLIEEKLNQIFPETSYDDRFMYFDHQNDMVTRAMEDPDYQEEIIRMVQFYG